MPDLRIDLSTHTNRFANGSLELSIAKKVNFIFGKNGTGKTTITDEIERQLSEAYHVRVFKDFDGVVENDRLNAVALGTENAEIQEKINIIDDKISGITKQIEKPDDKDLENLFTKAEKAKSAFDKHDKKIIDFCSFAAQQIKNISNPTIAKTSYNKNDFRDEISKVNILSDTDVLTHKNTIKADKKSEVGLISFPAVDLQSYLSSTNEVLQSKVEQPRSIPELKDSPEKQQFAKQGMEIHEHSNSEVCSFCGNEISEERWVALGNYFNNEVKKLETRIQNGVTKLKEELNNLDDIKEVDKNIFYEKFGDQIKSLNLQIKLKKKEYKEFLEKLETALSEKNKNLFAKTDILWVNIPEGFNTIQTEFGKLVEVNNKLSRNLKSEQDKAKDALRYHEAKKKLDIFKYDGEHLKLETLRTLSENAQTNLSNQKNELTTQQRNRTELILQTKDENKIAEKINKLLRGMGVASFSLKPVNDESEDQKGQYQIKGHDGNIRPITNLSRGEKNIVAFLYFLFSLDRPNVDSRPRIIVLDDPMTSNDDTMQYLMIGEIQKFYRNIKDDHFILFTHNSHFYLNVRPNTATTHKENGQEVSFYEKYGTCHLLSNGTHTTITPISKGKHDFKTSYETLWKELAFLYRAEDASPDLMLSPCRKICETYMNFTKKGIEAFYRDNTTAKKLFDVNQHSIDDLEAEQNGRTKEEIKNILHNLFEENGAADHINSYWKEAEL